MGTKNSILFYTEYKMTFHNTMEKDLTHFSYFMLNLSSISLSLSSGYMNLTNIMLVSME